MKEILKATALHAFVSVIYVGITYGWMNPREAFFAAWGCALAIIPSFGFSYLTAQDPTEEDSKKGVALVIAGSVLRYGIFLLLLAVLVFSSLRIPAAFIGGLLIWIPTSALMALQVRRTKKNDPL